MSIPNPNQGPTSYAAVPMPTFSVNPVKDWLLKAAIFSMSLATLLLAISVAWNGAVAPRPLPGPPPTPPTVTPNPPPNPPAPPTPPPINPAPPAPPINPAPPAPGAAAVTLTSPGMNVVRISVGDKLTAVIVNVVPVGQPLVNPNDLTAGTYPITATVDQP